MNFGNIYCTLILKTRRFPRLCTFPSETLYGSDITKMSLPYTNKILATKNTSLVWLFCLSIIAAAWLIYFPGLNGPFVFDDLANIVYNNNIKMQHLSLSALDVAAHSLNSGPLGRPIAGISFALNYYLAGGIEHTFSYKVFNLSVHIINGFLIFWFGWLILSLLQRQQKKPSGVSPGNTRNLLLAGTCAITWLVHPIQLTSVLYVVQRMTSMASMFMLLALILYIYARLALGRQERQKSIAYLVAAIIAGLAGVLSKEIALSLPLYIGIIELIFFYDRHPWSRWHQLSKKMQTLLITLLIISFLLLLIVSFEIAIPQYASRDFSMLERILTEGRVLIFYLGEILVPRLSAFGLYHDDISISHSLTSPWTSMTSVIFISVLLFYAIRLRKKYPLFAFSTLWFFIGHVLESTIFPLELVHEHRNYLPSFGPILLIISALFMIARNDTSKKIWLLIPLIIISLGTITAVRSTQWAKLGNLLEAETYNHPESPRAWADLSRVQLDFNLEKAIASINNSIKLKPKEPGYYLKLYLYSRYASPDIATKANIALLNHICDEPESKLFINTLHLISKCIETSCRDLQDNYGRWIEEAMKYSDSPRYKYYLGGLYYAQGDMKKALKLLNQSITESVTIHSSPYIKRIYVLLRQHNIDAAKAAFTELQEINKRYQNISSSEIQKIDNEIKLSEKKYNTQNYDNVIQE